MAKTSTKIVATPASAGTAPGVTFQYEETDTLPAPRAFGRRGGEPNPLMEAIRGLPAPQNGKFRFMFVPIDPVADTITDPAERQKAQREAQVKLAGKLSSMGRRLSTEVAKNNAGRIGPKFITANGEKDGVVGVRIYRGEDAEVKERAKPATEATPASTPVPPPGAAPTAAPGAF